jgi:DNA repair protein RadC
MEFDKEILRILMEAGTEGLSLQKVARHVFNAFNSFFNPLNYEDVHKYVAQYLLKNSKRMDSLIEKTDMRGYYRLNMDNQQSQQLMLQFREEQKTNNQNEELPKNEDRSLNLFDNEI